MRKIAYRNRFQAMRQDVCQHGLFPDKDPERKEGNRSCTQFLCQVNRFLHSQQAPKLCYAVEMERRRGNPDAETGLVEACGACTNFGRNKLYPTISIDSTRDMIFDLFITGGHTIDGERTLKTVLQSIMNYQSVNDVLFRSKQTNVEPVKIKNILFLLIVFRIVTLK